MFDRGVESGTFVSYWRQDWTGIMNFDILEEITEIETIAEGSGIREISRLRKLYGHGNWKKMKGGCTYEITVPNGAKPSWF